MFVALEIMSVPLYGMAGLDRARGESLGRRRCSGFSTRSTPESRARGRSASSGATASGGVVDEVVARYLDCGIWESGFARVRCRSCPEEGHRSGGNGGQSSRAGPQTLNGVRPSMIDPSS